mgnify:CR=1 FL=1
MRIQQFKNIARRLETLLAGRLKHTQIMDILAKSMGFRDYHGCKASITNPETEAEYQEFALTIHCSRSEFHDIWSQRNIGIFSTLKDELHLEEEHTENRHTVYISFSGDPKFLNNEMIGDVVQTCLNRNVKVTLVTRTCRFTDFAYNAEIAKKVKASLAEEKAKKEQHLKNELSGMLDCELPDILIEYAHNKKPTGRIPGEIVTDAGAFKNDLP